MTADTPRCSAHLVLERPGLASVMVGCPDEVVGYYSAVGILAFDGAQFVVALCADHVQMVMDNREITITMTLSAVPA